MVMRREPLRLAVTASAVDKSVLEAKHILLVDERGQAEVRGPRAIRGKGRHESVVTRRALRPSAETLLHLEIVRHTNAGAVLHTHSVWSTVLSDAHFARGGLELTGYEMLKGLHGVTTHEQRERIPIVENDQDMERLARRVGEALDQEPGVHALLLRRHGLYTWGDSLADAVRHVEILEFLFEAIGRSATYPAREVPHGAAQNS
jgi:methylthioribulose-1-phosphate dehydratase